MVRSITFAPDDPAKLIVDYDFNQRRISNAPEGVEAGFAAENERVVHVVTKHVVEQVAGGAKIGRVQIYEHVGDVSSITVNVNIQDMQAWSAGQINDNAYRQIWQRQPAAYPYPAPKQ